MDVQAIDLVDVTFASEWQCARKLSLDQQRVDKFTASSTSVFDMQRSRSALLTFALVAAIATLGYSVGAGFVCSPAAAAQPSNAAVNALRGALTASVLPVAANAMEESTA
eukprot:3403734-Amphidinium_carterae.1